MCRPVAMTCDSNTLTLSILLFVVIAHTTSHNKSQQVTTSHNKSQQVTTSHNESQQVTTSHNKSQQVTMSHESRVRTLHTNHTPCLVQFCKLLKYRSRSKHPDHYDFSFSFFKGIKTLLVPMMDNRHTCALPGLIEGMLHSSVTLSMMTYHYFTITITQQQP